MALKKKQLPDISEVLPSGKSDEASLAKKADETISAAVEKLIKQPNLVITDELTPMVVALNKAGVSDDYIATSLKKLMEAKKTIVIGTADNRIEKKIPDNPIILAATKFAAVLRDRIPSKRVTGKFLNLHGNIPKGQDKNILREREESLKTTHEAEFEVMSNEPVN